MNLNDAKGIIDGAQPKMKYKNNYLKFDLLGTEGLSEELTSVLLKGSNLEHVKYDSFKTKDNINGCISNDFKNNKDEISLKIDYSKIETFIDFLDYIEINYAPINIKSYAEFILKSTSLDVIILNTDRHAGNFKLLLENETHIVCPNFDCGLALCSDWKQTQNNTQLSRDEIVENTLDIPDFQGVLGARHIDDYDTFLQEEMFEPLLILSSNVYEQIMNYDNKEYNKDDILFTKTLLIRRLKEFEGVLWKKETV